MNNREVDPKTVAWVHQEVARLRREGDVAGSPRETDLLAHWKVHSPKMYQAWKAAGLVEKLAFVLDMKRYHTMRTYVTAGMPMADAEEQATRDWLMMGPEAEEHRNTNRGRRR